MVAAQLEPAAARGEKLVTSVQLIVEEARLTGDRPKRVGPLERGRVGPQLSVAPLALRRRIVASPVAAGEGDPPTQGELGADPLTILRVGRPSARPCTALRTNSWLSSRSSAQEFSIAPT